MKKLDEVLKLFGDRAYDYGVNNTQEFKLRQQREIAK